MFKISENEALDLLMNRLSTWTDNQDTLDLFEKMYESYLDSGVFEENTASIMEIVDNDYINWCNVVSAEDLSKKDFKKLVKLYKNGERDISCEDFDNIGSSYIEAVDDEENPTKFLLRC